MMLYASTGVVFSVKDFIESPTRDNFLKTIIAMRRDLSEDKESFDLESIALKSHSSD